MWGRSVSSFSEQQFARWFVKSMVCSQEDLIYELRRLKVVCNGLMPKSMVSLAVVYCRVPSTCMWYYLFDSDFLLAMFRVLHFGKPRLIVKVWPQLESWVVLLKRDLISILRNSSCYLESSAKIAILESTRKTLCLAEPCYTAILLACSVWLIYIVPSNFKS